MRITIVGAGNWGTALAALAGRAGHDVHLWSRNPTVVESINRDHLNSLYLQGIKLGENVSATGDFDVVRDAQVIILAAPSHALRSLLQEFPRIDSEATIVSAAKGIEIETGKRISQVVDEVLGSRWSETFVCLSGPSFAREVAEGHPTAIVAASNNHSAACRVQGALSFANLRIYTNNDVVGTELGGSVKNVMAIAAGMTTGLGFGSNSVAALITRGLAEISRLALHEGARFETMTGLAGLGDLVLTCTGALSRNRFVGEQLGKGKTLPQITQGMNEVAEGIKTTLAVQHLAEVAGLEMPITTEVKAVLYDGKSAREAVSELMSRPLKDEMG